MVPLKRISRGTVSEADAFDVLGCGWVSGRDWDKQNSQTRHTRSRTPHFRAACFMRISWMVYVRAGSIWREPLPIPSGVAEFALGTKNCQTTNYQHVADYRIYAAVCAGRVVV